MFQPKQKGFTLIELMIAVAIIGILLAIAIPEYKDHVIRSTRSVAQSYLADLAQRQELIFQDTRAYSNTAADFPPVPPNIAAHYTSPATFATTPPAAGTPAAYTITLTPIVGGLMGGYGGKPADGALTINNLGVRKRNGTIDW